MCRLIAGASAECMNPKEVFKPKAGGKKAAAVAFGVTFIVYLFVVYAVSNLECEKLRDRQTEQQGLRSGVQAREQRICKSVLLL